ncbi:MAG: ribonuclease [Gammaproteobacteria bacterium]|nr:ribonuclease [Gammaproteobacteria bacterium]
MRRYGWLVVALVVLAWWAWQRAAAPVAGWFPAPATQPLPDSAPRGRPQPLSLPPAHDASRWPAFLPRESLATLQRIERGGPHPYRQDGASFQNRERRLPSQPRGYYREYTVDTPGSRDRGPRRIVAGGGIPGQSRPVEYFYSDDHYRSFRRFEPARAEPQQ